MPKHIAAIDCLQRQIETSEHNAPILDAEGRHDDAFAARELAASCRLAIGCLMAEADRRLYGETPAAQEPPRDWQTPGAVWTLIDGSERRADESASDETIACPQPDPAPTVQEPPPRYLQIRVGRTASGGMTFDFVPYRDTSLSVGVVRRLVDGTVAVCTHMTTGGAPTTTASSNPDHD